MVMVINCVYIATESDNFHATHVHAVTTRSMTHYSHAIKFLRTIFDHFATILTTMKICNSSPMNCVDW